MHSGPREWMLLGDNVLWRRWQKFFRFLYPLFPLTALWELWLYVTGDGSLGNVVLRVFFAIAWIPALRAPRQFTVKASDETLFLPGVFRWRRIPWSQVAHVRLDTPKPWTTAVLVTTNDGKTRKTPLVKGVESLLEYWHDIKRARTDQEAG